MKLRKKIIATCILLVLIPILLGASAGTFIIIRQYDKVFKTYGVNSEWTSVIQNPLIVYNSIIKDSVKQIKRSIEEDPDRLGDVEFLDELNTSLSEYSSTVYVVRNGELFYIGDDEMLGDIRTYFQDYGLNNENPGSVYFNKGDISVLIESMNFENDNDLFSMYLVLRTDSFIPEVASGFSQIIFSIVIILVLVGIATLLWLNKLVIFPLTGLSKATHEIMDGNLDFSLKTNRRDEIGQLQNDFDDMRIHLKESTEQQINNAEASKEMMSNISHDLKTPLTAIKGYAEGLLDGVADTPEKQEKYIKTIYAKACNMEELVDELSYFSKLDNKTITYNFDRVELKEFIQDCIEDIIVDLETHHIRLSEIYQCDDGVRVIIDPNEIKRVFLNIIGNSIKYMDKDEGVISIRVLNDDEHAWITVEDNGRGMDAKDVSHVFERFYRADNSRGTRTGGTGLGLSIAKSIIEAHGGTITANSVKGVGTSIRFSLPCERKCRKNEEDTYE